ncbi:hypothetical protein LP52_10180 [Streptomonospora alba]|uniref:Uncharacterized protein n=1 Tax=Streptomonospora alba TaxID=183763 RepID=A0A0C2FIB0_9ACTN|nr:hypothetical protein LP52_10180 [Streptomonospora alba]
MARDEVAPAVAGRVLLPEQGVEAAAERVGVDERAAQAGAPGRPGQRECQQTGSCASATADDGDHGRVLGSRVRRLGEQCGQS